MIPDVSRRSFMKFGATAAVLASAAPAFADELAAGAPPHLIQEAMAAFGKHRTQIAHLDRFGIVDFSQPSSAPRFFLVDFLSGSAQAHLVAHGKGSDPAHTGWARRFSNELGSFASSTGAFVTGEEYIGENGRSMRLIGLDAENCNAESRAIVVHGAWYVAPDIAARTGKLGRSEGCFAVSRASLDLVIDQLGPGRLIYAAKG